MKKLLALASILLFANAFIFADSVQHRPCELEVDFEEIRKRKTVGAQERNFKFVQIITYPAILAAYKVSKCEEGR